MLAACRSALRGGILDIYPLYRDFPVRLEFFDTEVDSIRTFSAEDQRSIAKLERVSILPAVEFVWTKQELLLLAERLEEARAVSLKKITKKDVKELLLQNIQHDIDLLRQGDIPEQIVKYVSLLYKQPSYLADYFAQDGIVLFDELGRIIEVTDSLEKEEEEWFISLLEEGKIVHGTKLSFTFKEIMAMMEQMKVYFSLFVRTFSGTPIKRVVSFSLKPMAHFHGQMHLLKNEMERWKSGKLHVVILA